MIQVIYICKKYYIFSATKKTTTEKSPEKATTTNSETSKESAEISETSEKIGENQGTTVSSCKDEIGHCPTDPIGCIEAGVEAMNSCRKSCGICHSKLQNCIPYPKNKSTKG